MNMFFNATSKITRGFIAVFNISLQIAIFAASDSPGLGERRPKDHNLPNPKACIHDTY